ncbi:MAG: DUF423 domain-containing protein [Bacilli bacterium]
MHIFGRTAALLGAVAVALGAFGAHGLKDLVDAGMLANWETAVKYQMFHVTALFVVAYLLNKEATPKLRWAGNLFIVGTAIFSGSLYIMVLTGMKWLGAITPIGGVAFIIGWVLLALSIQSRRA